MSVIGKKLNPIQSSGGHEESPPNENKENSTIKPDDVLRLTSITPDYLCKPGTKMLKFNSMFEYMFVSSVTRPSYCTFVSDRSSFDAFK